MIAVCVAAGVVLVTGLVWYLRQNKPKSTFLNKESKEKKKVQLVERTQISHDTVQFRFALESPDQVLGLPCGNHFKLYCPNPKGSVEGQWNGKEDHEASAEEIERKYTPVTGDDTPGHVDLVIKVYKSGAVDRFPDGGKMSQYMGNLKVGDTMTISGPWGIINYIGGGVFKYGSSKVLECKHIGMMAGGTGLTPMLQIVQAVLDDKSDKTSLSLVYANQTEDDILCREQLEALQSAHPDQFKLWYTVDRPKEGWKYDAGHITADMIQAHLPGPGPDTLVLMCGPPPMVKYACKENLTKLGYASSSMLAF
jgi:cytochrome-b5 reductase